MKGGEKGMTMKRLVLLLVAVIFTLGVVSMVLTTAQVSTSDLPCLRLNPKLDGRDLPFTDWIILDTACLSNGAIARQSFLPLAVSRMLLASTHKARYAGKRSYPHG
jgi:hypothetical protein